MVSLQNVYDRSPVWLQHVMTTGSGLQKNRKRYGKDYWDYRDFLAEFDVWPLERKLEYRGMRLRGFIARGSGTSQFCRTPYGGTDFDDIRALAYLESVTIVEKRMVRSHIGHAYAVAHKGSIEAHTRETASTSMAARSGTK